MREGPGGTVRNDEVLQVGCSWSMQGLYVSSSTFKSHLKVIGSQCREVRIGVM